MGRAAAGQALDMRNPSWAFGVVRQSLVGQEPFAHGAAASHLGMHAQVCFSLRSHCHHSRQAWQAAGGSIDWCRDLGVDGRSMRFARDIRQQLERIIGPDGSGFDGGSGRQRAERQRGSESGGTGGSGEAARRDEQPAAEGRQREGERERDSSKRERERHSDSRGGKRPRRSGGFCDAATLSALRMALTIGALWLQGTCTSTGLAQLLCNWPLCAPHVHNTLLEMRLLGLQGLPTGWRGACPCTTATARLESRPRWRR